MNEQQGMIFLQPDTTLILSNPDTNMFDYLLFQHAYMRVSLNSIAAHP